MYYFHFIHFSLRIALQFKKALDFDFNILGVFGAASTFKIIDYLLN